MTKDTRWTPGPWIYRKATDGVVLTESGNIATPPYVVQVRQLGGARISTLICEVYRLPRDGEDVRMEANGNLIAAAPELYEALEAAHDALDRQNALAAGSCLFCRGEGYDGDGLRHTDDCVIIRSRQSLAKARGEVQA